ncbi:MAG: hypothetical protein AAGD32_05265 [Planctomycetota bacterium]
MTAKDPLVTAAEHQRQQQANFQRGLEAIGTLPPGPTRDQLTEFAHQSNFRVTEMAEVLAKVLGDIKMPALREEWKPPTDEGYKPKPGERIERRQFAGGRNGVDLGWARRDIKIIDCDFIGQSRYPIWLGSAADEAWAGKGPVDELLIQGCRFWPSQWEALLRGYGNGHRVIGCTGWIANPDKGGIRFAAGDDKEARDNTIVNLCKRTQSGIAFWPHANPESADPSDRIRGARAIGNRLTHANIFVGDNVEDAVVTGNTFVDVPDDEPLLVISGGDRNTKKSGRSGFRAPNVTTDIPRDRIRLERGATWDNVTLLAA